jgi:hypothetical protein
LAACILQRHGLQGDDLRTIQKQSRGEHAVEKRDEHGACRVRRGKKLVRVVRMALGKGVVAERRFAEDEVIGEITGEIIEDLNYGSEYCMDMGDSRSLEPGAPFRFMNHSCQPNCALTWFDATTPSDAVRRRRIFVVALDYIESGEALTIDYAWPAFMAIRCRCRAEQCRGWVVSEQDLPKLLAAQAVRGAI